MSDDDPANPLSYMPPRDDGEHKRREANFAALGAILSTLAILGMVFFFIMDNLNFGHPATPPPLKIGSSLCLAGVAVVIIGGIAYYHWTQLSSKAFTKGALIGIGIGLLIEGVCFAANHRW